MTKLKSNIYLKNTVTKHGTITEYNNMKKLLIVLFLFIAGYSSAQQLKSVHVQGQFDSTTVGTVGSKVRLNFGFPVLNPSLTFNALVALDSIRIYRIGFYGDTTLQKFKMSTSDTLKTLLTGFTGTVEVLLDNPAQEYYVPRVNAVLLTTTRVVYIRFRGINY